MNSVMKKDFKRLMLDTDEVQEYVEVLGQGNAVDAGGGRQRDLTQLASRIVHLDFDLRTMLLDCAILGRQYWKTHNLPLIHPALYTPKGLFERKRGLKYPRVGPYANKCGRDRPSTDRRHRARIADHSTTYAPAGDGIEASLLRTTKYWHPRGSPGILAFDLTQQFLNIVQITPEGGRGVNQCLNHGAK